MTWNLTNIVIWATAEVNLVTVSACFPTILPAFMFFFNRCIPGSTFASGHDSKGLGNGDNEGNGSLRSQGGEKSFKLNILPQQRYEEYSSTCNLVHKDSIGDNSGDFDSQPFYTNHQGESSTVINGHNDERVNDRTVEEGQSGVLGTSMEKEIIATF